MIVGDEINYVLFLGLRGSDKADLTPPISFIFIFLYADRKKNFFPFLKIHSTFNLAFMIRILHLNYLN